MRVKSASIQSTRRTVIRLFPPTAEKFGSSGKSVLWRGLFISLGALLVAVFAAALFSDSLDESRDLLWSLALVPALLLASPVPGALPFSSILSRSPNMFVFSAFALL